MHIHPHIHPDTVRDAVTKQGMTKKEIADRASVNKNSLQGIESDDWNPTWSTLVKLCVAVEKIKRERA